MKTKEERFIERCNDVKESVIKAMDDALARAIGNKCICFDKCEDNYLDAYAFMGSVLQKELHEMLDGSSYESTNRNTKRKAAQYLKDFRIWHDYAGDYKGTGE